uniref:Uncharacterized protein n=1 Tax=Aquisalinus luteolus TaxID=1566827 RepID=A0A8J3A0V4_9PROT|nr:hypothetical protein GCM10011355_08710 [Aquisalinus luteolus]
MRAGIACGRHYERAASSGRQDEVFTSKRIDADRSFIAQIVTTGQQDDKLVAAQRHSRETGSGESNDPQLRSALSDPVTHLLVGSLDKANVDLWMLLRESAHLGGDECSRCAGKTGDPQCPREMSRGRSHVRIEQIELPEGLAGSQDGEPTRFRKQHTISAPHQYRYLKIFLDCRDGAADRRLRHPEVHRRSREPAMIDNGQQGSQLGKCHAAGSFDVVTGITLTAYHP